MQTDATAALRNAQHLGPGRMKHLKASTYYMKETIRRKQAKIEKIDTKENGSDWLTKHVNKEVLTSLSSLDSGSARAQTPSTR